MKTCHTLGIYPGTFDPVTYGHIDLIKRATSIFEEVIVAVAHQSTEKKALFSVKERMELLRRATRGILGVRVEEFDGLVVDFARKRGVGTMVRGIRMLSDFEYEFQMALTNRKIANEIQTIFLMPHESYVYISSRLVKQLAELGADVSPFVPKFILEAIQEKYKKR